jgi:YidC/Oxa1 family membrane protein insertase
MDPQAKRTLLATLLCLAILLGWLKVQSLLHPPPAAPPAPITTTAEGLAPEEASRPSAPAAATATTQPATISAAPEEGGAVQLPGGKEDGLVVSDAASADTVSLGNDRENNPWAGFVNPYEFSVVITPRGAGVETVKLSRHRNRVAKDKRHPDHDPYDLLRVLEDPATQKRYASFVTEWVRLVREDKGLKKQTRTAAVGEGLWTVGKTVDEQGETAALRTIVREEGGDILGVEKIYRLDKGSQHLKITLGFQNLSDRPFELIVCERGPVGIPKEDLRYEYRRAMVAVIDDQGAITLGENTTRKKVLGEEGRSPTLAAGDRHLLWSEVGNKYFACILAPLPQPSAASKEAYPKVLSRVSARAFSESPDLDDDLTLEQEFNSSGLIAPGQQWTVQIDTYCGSKSKTLFDRMPEAQARNYQIASNPDHSGCTFEVLSRAMLWLLTAAYGKVHNYGIAIIILVIVVRVILHPVTKRGQINMMKMQKGMAKLKPKIEAIQQQCKNDKQKLNEETMKLYREEGINPAGQILGCLPMLLQMPVWVALWTTLNTNVDMRHEPFFGWIRDLSSPDSLIPLPASWYFTIPLLGGLMGPVEAFNLLPLIMTVTMYAQQKFTQKLSKPAAPPLAQVNRNGAPLPDQMAQQQKMMNFMSIFFGFLFYNFPSGLNLYILSSNLLGMGEQFLIKKHIREKEERGDFEIKKREEARRAGPSLLGRLQKKVEQIRLVESDRPKEKTRKKARQTKL